MKKISFITVSALALALVLSGFVLARDKEDLQAIKKAVKENPAYESGKPAQWFKVLVSDSLTGKVKVRITMPISLVEILAKYADQNEKKEMRIDREDIHINLSEIFAELKKLGPLMFIEVTEEDETVKIWLE